MIYNAVLLLVCGYLLASCAAVLGATFAFDAWARRRGGADAPFSIDASLAPDAFALTPKVSRGAVFEYHWLHLRVRAVRR